MVRSCDTPSHPSPIIRILAQPRRVNLLSKHPCRPLATLHGVVFDILAARTFEGDFSNVTRSYAGNGTVRHALVGPAYEYPRGA
jgi:hypothetical protein